MKTFLFIFICLLFAGCDNPHIIERVYDDILDLDSVIYGERIDEINEYKNDLKIIELMNEKWLNDAYDITYWTYHYIKYVSDNQKYNLFEYYQSPKETLTLKTGDCDDISILQHKMLSLKGCISHIGVFMNKKNGKLHTSVYSNGRWFNSTQPYQPERDFLNTYTFLFLVNI
jgi:hypothetical protein